MTDATTPLVIRRTYAHPRERVFDAFSTATALESWLAPSRDIVTNVLEFEFAVGGRYRIAFELPDGVQTVLGGQYTRIDRPTCLGMSWCWEPPDPHGDVDSHLTVDFLDRSGATEVVIHHAQLSGPGMKERHTGGWQGSLQRLERLLQWVDADSET